VRRASRAASLLAALAMTPTCKPDLAERTSIVASPRLIAVRAEPPEAAPRAQVTLTALWADPAGASAPAPIAWAFCNARKALGETGPVSAQCLTPAGELLAPLGSGTSVASALPDKGCKNFGPEVPDATKDSPAGRPVDPDATGGYYQPITLTMSAPEGDAVSIASVRLTCGVLGASPEQLAVLAATSHPNENPALAEVLANGAPLADGAELSGAVRLRASWAACAPGDARCTGAEHYATYDASRGAVAPRRESIRVAWYATGGAFAVESNGRGEGDDATFVENEWTPPMGEARLWMVVRDARGGVGWRAFAVRGR